LNGTIFGAFFATNIYDMIREFYELDVDTLQNLYQKETNRLHAELIAGASWESLKEQKAIVTELAIVLHKKKKIHI
jgi:hypothetical protein